MECLKQSLSDDCRGQSRKRDPQDPLASRIEGPRQLRTGLRGGPGHSCVLRAAWALAVPGPGLPSLPCPTSAAGTADTIDSASQEFCPASHSARVMGQGTGTFTALSGAALTFVGRTGASSCVPLRPYPQRPDAGLSRRPTK